MKVKVWIIEEKRWMISAILCPGGYVVEYDHPDDLTQLDFIDFDNKKIYHPSDVKVIQYTGVNDNNGIEIYEGDIIDIKNWGIDSIEWDNGNLCYKLYQGKTHAVDGEFSCGFDCVVIGNIYENPGLLEK